VPGQPHEARRALGAKLRELRLDAGLSARKLAQLAAWHFTKVSRLENGVRTPTRDDILTWCRICGGEDQAPDLIAMARSVDAMYAEWRRKMRAGLKHFQDGYRALYEETAHFRAYETTVLPGLLTTAAYSGAILRFWANLMQTQSDIDAAVATRMERQHLLYSGKHSFEFILEEQALRTLVGDAEVMAGQLDRLLAMMSLPKVTIGIIPAGGARQSFALGSFWIFDDSRVQVETVSALLDVTQPAEISVYEQVFDLLKASAVYGRAARECITRASRELVAD
jgi:transcriptional regulator with XRE-family HTH domain